MVPIIDWKNGYHEKTSWWEIVRVGGKSQRFIMFGQMLKSFWKDIETLWKLVKKKYGSTRLEDILDRVLWVI